MKYLHLPLAACLFFGVSLLNAQSKPEAVSDADSAEVEEVVIPTEVSEAPYEIGNLVTESGYYIDQGEELPKINIRIVDNRFRIYWIDENGLIAEPEHKSASMRFFGANRGIGFLPFKLLNGGEGLECPRIMAPPHLYNAVLVFPATGDAEPVSHPFRYTINLDKEVDPEIPTDSE